MVGCCLIYVGFEFQVFTVVMLTSRYPLLGDLVRQVQARQSPTDEEQFRPSYSQAELL